MQSFWNPVISVPFLVFIVYYDIIAGFIVVAACVMTFEARDSAAKVVPARFKISTTGPSSGSGGGGGGGGGNSHFMAHNAVSRGSYSGHGSLKTSGSQTGSVQQPTHPHGRLTSDRRALIESFMVFSRSLGVKAQNKSSLNVPQV